MTEKNYELKLNSKDNPYDHKLPDFTFTYQGSEYYWEHLGMLSVEQYKKSWERKLEWYIKNGYESKLVISKDGDEGSINSKEIDKIIEEKVGIKAQHPLEFNIENLKENQNVEFKASISWDYNQNKKNKELEFIIAKTVSAFMNSSGGLLVVGIDDNKNVLGIENDLKLLKKQDDDGFQLKITEIISNFIGKEFTQLISFEFKEIDNSKIVLIKISRADGPTFVEHNSDSTFFIRTGNSTQPLNSKEATAYIRKHWK